MAKAVTYVATWNNVEIGKSSKTVKVEGNQYFPLEDVEEKYFEASKKTSYCGWKGDCSYYSLKVGDKENKDAVWYYPEPKDAAKEIKGHVAFWKGVKVTKV